MKYRSKKEEIFYSIYEECEADVYRACYFILKDPYLAEDFAIQALINVYEKCDGVKPEFWKKYAIKIGMNLSFNYMKRKQREQLVEGMEQVYSEDAEIPSCEDAFLSKLRKKENAELVKRIYAGLKVKNKDWHDILYMTFVENKSYEEISKELGIPKSSLYSKMQRAKDWIREKYGDDFEKLNDD